MRKALVLLVLLFSCALSGKAQKPPAWLRSLPETRDGRVYGIGISDLGLDQQVAFHQARRRAVVMLRMFSSPEVSSVEITTLLDPETGKPTFNPRTAVEITIPLGIIQRSSLREEGRYLSAGVWFVLWSALMAPPDSTVGNEQLRLVREGDGAAALTVLSVQAWSDSVVIDLNQQGEVTEFQSAYPSVSERIRVSGDPIHTSRPGPGWMRTKAKKGAAASTEITAMKGRFSPFMSLLHASAAAMGEFARRTAPESISYEDPSGPGLAPSFATVARENRVEDPQARLTRLQVSRFASLYQVAVRVEQRLKNN